MAYVDAAVTLDGPQVTEVVTAARDLGVFTHLGITQRGTASARGTVFATLLAVDPHRGLVSAHRKLRPTYEERLVWGAGDGHGLRVHGHRYVRVGGLNGWENWMLQARHALYAGGEDVHVSVWPGSSRLTRDITRFIALEEAIVTADVDMARVREARQSFDPTGHYARPDVFRVQVDRRRLSAAEFLDS